jgi:hypothetical protein
MRDFCEAIEDGRLREQLLTAIHGRGAFRYFKDSVHGAGIADEWYAFRREVLVQIAKDWLEDNEIPYRDAPEEP